jgi:uncharacterized membrane protein YiaA
MDETTTISIAVLSTVVVSIVLYAIGLNNSLKKINIKYDKRRIK